MFFPHSHLIYLVKQGFHLKPVAAEIRRLHFTLPQATFYVSRIKKMCNIFPKPFSWQRPRYFFITNRLYRHDYWPLNCKQYKPNRQKSHRFSLASESLVPVYGMNKFYTKNQSILTLFNQAPPVGRPYTNSVPLTMQSQVSKSRNVTLFFKTGDALKVSGHALFTSKPSSNNKTLNARLLARVITGCHYT